MEFRVGQFIRHVNGVQEYRHVGYEKGRPYSDDEESASSDDEESASSEPVVITEYEVLLCGAFLWSRIDCYSFPSDLEIKYTGRTRKVVVQ